LALDLTDTKGAMTGQRYIDSLKDDREVWLDGQRVKDVTTHPAFTGIIHELARIYDLQHTDAHRDTMTFASPETGNRVSYSWLVPKTLEDSQAKRANSELWNKEAWGQLGRGPDVLAPFILMLDESREVFGEVKNEHCDFGENIHNYYKYCMENDLFLTHALGDPQVDRSAQPQNERRVVSEEELSLHVVEETKDGVIVRGGKQLATAAPITNETYVSLSATFVQRAEPAFVLAFSIPTNTKGMQIFCREPVSIWPGTWGHPLGHLYDEQDSMLFFDDVLVPWDRLFALYDTGPLLQRYAMGANQLGWANMTRVHYRMRLITAVATMIAEAIGVIEYREVASKIGEMASYCEIWRHALEGFEHLMFQSGGVQKAGASTQALHIWFAQTSQRMVQILREIAGSGIIMQPSEADLANPTLRPYLERYMRGKEVDVEYKSRLYRLAHELAVSSFGMRQEVYEYWHSGDPNRNRVNLLRRFDQAEIREQITELISKPLPHGPQLEP